MAKHPAPGTAYAANAALTKSSVSELTGRKIKERIIEFFMFLAALSSIGITVGIVGILVLESWHFFEHVSVVEFLTDNQWT
jgi:phosphate transport system permease protein